MSHRLWLVESLLCDIIHNKNNMSHRLWLVESLLCDSIHIIDYQHYYY